MCLPTRPCFCSPHHLLRIFLGASIHLWSLLGKLCFFVFLGIQTCSCGPVGATWRYNLQREQSNFWLRIVFLHCLRVFTGKLFIYPMMEFWGFPFSTFHLFPQFRHCRCCSCLSSMEEIAMPISHNGGMRYWVHGKAPKQAGMKYIMS